MAKITGLRGSFLRFKQQSLGSPGKAKTATEGKAKTATERHPVPPLKFLLCFATELLGFSSADRLLIIIIHCLAVANYFATNILYCRFFGWAARLLFSFPIPSDQGAMQWDKAWGPFANNIV